MKFIGNLIWLLLGGFLIALEYFIASVLLMLTIVGIPFGFQTLKLASLALWPFGRKTVYLERSTGCISTFMNVLWILAGGIWIAISHLILGVILYVTIIGIPFGRQHLKLASIALNPFGRKITTDS